MDVAVGDWSMTVDDALVDAPRGEIRRQVAAYLAGDRRSFDLDVAYLDDFTGEVMAAMAAIPYGETRTYGDVAAELDTAAVAVGGACGRNPVPIVVPCHRVVGADSLGGFSAGGDDGLALKAHLLALESTD